jgi:ATP-dependent Clp protease ATP-binding subunit ClpC
MKVWDIFLQVFDEGRLTDPNGNTANFRHSIIILTSNLGGTVKTGSGLGFTPAENVFSLTGVSQAITKTFRPEFINRLDRMIIFRPLNRSVMREILYKELDLTMTRRGLRNRNWAVEWESSAIDFLLEKGFTSDLGARPLKRAIERYLLSPLAITMVNHQVPEGDQFLFVRSDGGKLKVEFIDPDVPAEATPAVTEEAEEPEDLDLRQIVLEARGLPEEFDVLSKVYQDLYQGMAGAQWQQDKQELFARMSEKGFWDSDDRFRLLGEIEFLDRIEAGLSSAGSLMARLDRKGKKDRKTFSAQLIARLAQQLFLVNTAYNGHNENIPRDAFLKIESQARDGTVHKFAGELADMYIKWAKKRRMQFKILQEDRSKCCFMLAVSGFGAYAILRHEDGRHVLEMPRDARNFKRLSVSVQVAVQPDQPSDLLEQAKNVFAQAGEGSNEIIRRYRYEPSPLVRDSKRQWRTGRLDLVLDGNFDLMH